MAKVVAVSKDTDGTILVYKLDDGRLLGHDECVTAVLNGEIEGLQAQLGKPTLYGTQDYIVKGVSDGDPTNNLGNLPIF